MKKLILSVAMFAVLVSPAVAQPKAEDMAKEVATQWLALIDNKDYQASWDATASYFKDQLTAEQWSAALNRVEKQVGTVDSRKFLSATYMTQLPNAPKGEYVIVLFEATLKDGTKAVETVTPMMDIDKQWRVSGYYIAPLNK